ncbi:hypothetical protein QCN29_10800 [Streptomyces sp. HNM0663]|uniref:Uncharacterized protein n=1 Tax=Streptomyces chengmaiensis TaxID=3040919 RepID=A0ABT6HKX5_9ACTN|nr:hypothetical protein [Streptomyces chengmaiensis]MDH2389270.1 hypothetical protein [Streptomyces chengmaiensis]
MPQADSSHVDAAELLTLALRHLDDYDTRRPFTEIPTLDDSTPLPFRPFPALAIAMAGHVLSAWEVRTFQVERAKRGERIRFFTAVGTEPGRTFRACTLFDPELGTQSVVELCGHAFCSNKAPAGPGSRCADHLGDPPPDGRDPCHWLRRAGEAAISVERGRRGLTETEALAVHAARAGVPMAQVRRATGLPEWTVHALSGEPASVPEGVDGSDAPAAWPLVLTPVRDITAADVHRVYAYTSGSPAPPGPDTVLARKDRWYTYEPLRENGPFLVFEDEHCFTLQWWQMQDHLPEHQLARPGDESRRRDMYEPPCQCGDCDY